MSRVTIKNIVKQFGKTVAVQDVNLEIASGEFFSILGPSGCGKTTLLRMVAGFERPTSGAILIESRDVTNIAPQFRGVGMVFQNYALFPHMTVFENVAFGLETKKMQKAEIRRQVEEILDAVHLLNKIETPVPQLSGGEQQRVAVARALVVKPAVLLMDEPLSNLDVTLRLKTREEIRSLQKKTGITTIYVTHDQSEAMSLSDRIAVMRGGKVEQVGSPSEMYEAPASPFVAEFLGGANMLKGRLSNGERELVLNKIVISVPKEFLEGRKDGSAVLIVKPEAIILNSDFRTEEYKGIIIHKEYLGFITNFTLELAGMTLRATVMSTGLTKSLRVGDAVGLKFDWSRCALLPLS